MLKTIWIGKASIAQHILLDARYKTLPDDLVAWIVLSRWAIARAYLAGKGSAGILPGQIGDVAKSVFTATTALGPVDTQAENKMMRELDGRIGVQPSETDLLIRYVGDLRGATRRPGIGMTARVAATP